MQDKSQVAQTPSSQNQTSGGGIQQGANRTSPNSMVAQDPELVGEPSVEPVAVRNPDAAPKESSVSQPHSPTTQPSRPNNVAQPKGAKKQSNFPVGLIVIAVIVCMSLVFAALMAFRQGA